MLLAAAAFVLAFVQRPGMASADTKINLHVDPGRFLADVASMWTSTGQLGDVQSGQQAGYLFPMGPFFALGHALGLSDWVVQRLWLGAVLALAAWGVARLLRGLLGGPARLAQLVAGAVTLLNPFVVTYANRTTVTFLAYAALPWLMLAVHRGLRESRGWRWPAFVALLVTASGGGINGAVTAWMLLGPVLLLLYEAAFTSEVDWWDARAFLLRTVPIAVIVSLWWVVPAYVQSSYGINFLHFTEQPGTVWGTTSATESLRLMSFWLSYVGIGFAGRAIPYFADSTTLLFSAPVVVASLLLPALALGGFVWTRRWRYGPFFLGLALIAVLIMMAGFPEGTPLRHGLYFTYNHVSAVQFLRASYKAGPLLAVALACLAGAAGEEVWSRLGGRRAVLARSAAALGGLAILVLAAWPLATGRAQDPQVSFKRVPAAWRRAATDLDRQLPANARAIVLPGDLFSFYTWGGTVDPILPALSRRPVAERAEVPYADLRATDLLWTIDSLVHQQRLLPGALPPLLSLIGVRSVISGTDDDLARSDAPAPADAAAVLSAQPGFGNATRSYGPVSSFSPTGVGPPVALPQVRRYDLPSARPLVRIEPRAQPLVVDGSAGALAGLAAFGALPADRAVLYSGDLSVVQLRDALRAGGQLVISDSNRRQAFVAASLEQNRGPVLTAAQTVSADGYILDPVGRGPDFQTVASYSGVSSVEAPYSPLNPQFPEHAPFAAIDGSSATAWLADPTLGAGSRWLQVDFRAPRDVPYIDLDPYSDAGGEVRSVSIAGRVFALHPGFNRLQLGLRAVAGLRVSLVDVGPPVAGAKAGAGGIRELRIPGIRAGQSLRLPLDAAAALRGQSLAHVGVSYLFERSTGDEPYRRDVAHGPWSAGDVHQPGDAEATMRRSFELPVPRSFTAVAWAAPFSQTPDDQLDRLAGYAGAVRATSSSRFDGEPRYRASMALDGSAATAWIGDWQPGTPAWIQVTAPASLRVSVLRLRPPALAVRRPTLVRVLWPGGATGPLRVSAGDFVRLPGPVRARSLRIEIVAAQAPAGASAGDERAVGIAEIEGIGGLPAVRTKSNAGFSAPCGTAAVRVDGRVLALRVDGSSASFEQGTPLRAVSCGSALALGTGMHQLSVLPGPLALDELRLYSPAPISAATAAGAGSVLGPGVAGRGSYDHVRVSVRAPSWLVLGEGYNSGWQAFCNGRSVGAPIPIDGYANGWPVGQGCRDVHFAFAPNRLAAVGYILSGAGAVLCLILIAAGAWQRRRSGRRTAQWGERTEASRAAARPVRARSPVRTAVLVLAGAVVFGFVFGIVPGIVSLPAIAFVAWRRVGAGALTLLATALLAVVVPILYLVHTGQESGGNHYGYAVAHMGAHYVAVAALGLLAAALWRSLRTR